MVAQLQRIYTPEDYLDREVNCDTRHEYRNGEILPMTGGTPAHNKIANHFNRQVADRLDEEPYEIFLLDQRLWIPDWVSSLNTKQPIALSIGDLYKKVSFETAIND